MNFKREEKSFAANNGMAVAMVAMMMIVGFNLWTEVSIGNRFDLINLSSASAWFLTANALLAGGILSIVLFLFGENRAKVGILIARYCAMAAGAVTLAGLPSASLLNVVTTLATIVAYVVFLHIFTCVYARWGYMLTVPVGGRNVRV